MHSPVVTDRHLHSSSLATPTISQTRLRRESDRAPEGQVSGAGMPFRPQFPEILQMYSRGNYQDIIRRNMKVCVRKRTLDIPLGVK